MPVRSGGPKAAGGGRPQAARRALGIGWFRFARRNAAAAPTDRQVGERIFVPRREKVIETKAIRRTFPLTPGRRRRI
jgi:hypothetical protein